MNTENAENTESSGNGQKENAAKIHFDRKKCLIVAGIIAAALIAAYLIVAFIFQSRYLPNTVINGAKCGGKTVEEVQTLLRQETDHYELTLKERGDKEETIAGADISVDIEFGDVLDELLEGQNSFAWISHMFRTQDMEAEQMVVYDSAALDKVIAALSCTNEDNMTDSENASLSGYIEGKGYELIDAVYGTRLDTKKLADEVEKAIIGLQTELDLTEIGCYTDPEYTEESDEAIAMLERANKYVNTTVTYEFGDKTEVLDGSVISEWINVDEDLTVSLNTEKAGEFVSGLAEKYNTAGKSKSLKTSYGQTVTVPGGNYGWKIDQGTTKDELIGYLEAGEDYTGNVAYSQTAASHGDNDYGNTYVEINLTAQHLYFYKNGSLVVQSDFVSGDVSKGRTTPTGSYRVTYKQKDAVLRGQGYASPVSFWMPFNGGVGLHDASWRSTFGGTIYKTNGSHGCINLPYSVAKTIYNNISAGDPVLVYTLAGTENSSTSADAAAQAEAEAAAAAQAQAEAEAAAAAQAQAEAEAAAAAAAAQAQAEAEAAAAAAAAQAEAEAQQQASVVVNAINSIGTVTLDSGSAISGARSQYDGLSDAAKSYVSNYDTLTAAEAAYAALLQQQQDSQQPEPQQ